MSVVPTPTPTPTPTPVPKREFDQIVSADVKIKKVSNSDDEYKITLVSNVSKVLLYQVWCPTSATLNSDRKVFELKATDWANLVFYNSNNSNSPLIAPAVSYTPTCVMELEDGECPIHKHKDDECRHVFVINYANVEEVNDCRKVVFYVSSKDIDKNNKNRVIKKLKKIPTTKKGKLFHARFDIDSSDMIDENLFTDVVVNNSNSIASAFNQQIINFYKIYLKYPNSYNSNNIFELTSKNIFWHTITSSDGGYWAYLAYVPDTTIYVPVTAILGNYIIYKLTSSIRLLFRKSYYYQLLYSLSSYFVIKLDSSKSETNVYIGNYIQPSGVNENKYYSNSIPQQFQIDFNTYVANNSTSPVTISSLAPLNFIGITYPYAKFAWVKAYTDGGKPPEVTFYNVTSKNPWLNTSTANNKIPVVNIFGVSNSLGVNSVYNSDYNCWNLSFYVYDSDAGYLQGPPVNYDFSKETNQSPNYTCTGWYPIPQGLF